MRRRRGSGAERRGSGAVSSRAGISSILWGALVMGSYYAHLAAVGRIAGEVAVFDSQDPVVVDRSAPLCK